MMEFGAQLATISSAENARLAIDAARLISTTAAEFGKNAMQAWNFHIIINLAVLGWAFTTRKPENAGLHWLPAIAVGVVLMGVSVLTAANAIFFTARADVALQSAQAIVSNANAFNPAMLANVFTPLSDTDPLSYFFTPETLQTVWVFLAADCAAALLAAVLLSRIGRSTAAQA